MGLAQIHDELAKVAPIKSVRLKSGVAEIIFNDLATASERVAAYTLLKQIEKNTSANASPLTDDEIRWVRDRMQSEKRTLE